MSTHYLVCYDVTEDDIRLSVSNICKNFGLSRIQYSVFYGLLERSQLSMLSKELKSTLEGANGDIHIIKVCQSCERDHKVIASFSINSVTKIADESYEDVKDEFDAFSGVLIL